MVNVKNYRFPSIGSMQGVKISSIGPSIHTGRQTCDATRTDTADLRSAYLQSHVSKFVHWQKQVVYVIRTFRVVT